ncbi:MAG: nuclear transport factor 2 family protein [Candidatus Kariarchaeaceae archaeon]|jgi:hypothetical protein
MQANEVEEIHKIIKSKYEVLFRAWKAKEVVQIVNLLSEESEMVFEDGFVMGKVAIKQMYDNLMEKNTPIDGAVISKSVYYNKGQIYELGWFEEVVDTPNGRREFKANYAAIWIKEDGDWKRSRVFIPPLPPTLSS